MFSNIFCTEYINAYNKYKDKKYFCRHSIQFEYLTSASYILRDEKSNNQNESVIMHLIYLNACEWR